MQIEQLNVQPFDWILPSATSELHQFRPHIEYEYKHSLEIKFRNFSKDCWHSKRVPYNSYHTSYLARVAQVVVSWLAANEDQRNL